jgi:iron complex transport system substrate-binding protein
MQSSGSAARVASTLATRVASVLPSATEMVCYIGGRDLMVGRSHEDNFPASVTSLPILTGQTTSFTTAAEVDKVVSESIGKGESLYTLNVDELVRLKPDVILTQDICSVCAIDLQTVERVAASMVPAPRVVSLNPLNLDDVLNNLLEVGDAIGMPNEARTARAALIDRIAAVDRRVEARRREGAHSAPKVAFIEWSDPLYVGGHWTPQLIERAGGVHPLNAGGQHGAGKSFPVPSEAVVNMEPDLVIVAPCGLDLAMTRREAAALAQQGWWRSLKAVREGRVALVDGDAMFNRPGPRLVDALEWLYSAIHADDGAAPAGFPAEWLPPLADVTPPAQPGPAQAQTLADIEEAHRCAVQEGKLQYIDPETGYKVFTQLASSKRGRCCGSGCRQCVYDHANVKPERKAQLQPPITCTV